MYLHKELNKSSTNAVISALFHHLTWDDDRTLPRASKETSTRVALLTEEQQGLIK